MRGTSIDLHRGMDSIPRGALIAAPAERGFSCTNFAISLCGFSREGDAYARRVLAMLDRQAKGPHMVLLRERGATHALALYQSDRCRWHDRLYDRARGYEWIDLFHALGRGVARVAAAGEYSALGFEHPSGGGWRYVSGTAFLEGVGMEFDLDSVACRRIHLSNHECERGCLERSLATLTQEQLSKDRPTPRSIEWEAIEPHALLRGSPPHSVEVEAWRITLTEP